VLRIQRSANGEVIFRLVGRIDADSVAQLTDLFALEPKGKRMILDLKDVTIVNRDAVLFLSACESDDVELTACPPYVREWISRERRQSLKVKKRAERASKRGPKKKM
jgi:hypothetical protein